MSLQQYTLFVSSETPTGILEKLEESFPEASSAVWQGNIREYDLNRHISLERMHEILDVCYNLGIREFGFKAISHRIISK